jgi:ribonuclease T1
VNRNSGLALAIVVVMVLGGWLLSSFRPGADVGAPASPTRAAESATPTRISGTPGAQPTSERRGQQTDPATGLGWIGTSELPPEARDVLRRIDTGGPFKYDKDGATFNNFEGVLPDRPRGYYREFTVETPGSRDRGARRIVTGDNDRIRFWTDDHYDSFARIRQ